MDNQAVIEGIMKNLSFELEPSSTKQTNNDSFTEIDPLNIKIRIRKKETKPAISQGFISNNQSEPELVLQKVRLINSDETIMSFDILVEKDYRQNALRKPRKHFFDKFKPGLCFKQSDNNHIYLPNSEYNTHAPEDSLTTGFWKQPTLCKNTMDNFNSRGKTRREKMFLGTKCKSGGCLDPPSDEDICSYKPSIQVPSGQEIKSTGKAETDAVPPDGKPKTTYVTKKNKKPEDMTIIVKHVDKNIENETVPKIQQESSTISLITYPSHDKSSKIDSRRNKYENVNLKIKTSNAGRSNQSFNESNSSFFSPSRGIKRDSNNYIQRESSTIKTNDEITVKSTNKISKKNDELPYQSLTIGANNIKPSLNVNLYEIESTRTSHMSFSYKNENETTNITEKEVLPNKVSHLDNEKAVSLIKITEDNAILKPVSPGILNQIFFDTAEIKEILPTESNGVNQTYTDSSNIMDTPELKTTPLFSKSVSLEQNMSFSVTGNVQATDSNSIDNLHLKIPVIQNIENEQISQTISADVSDNAIFDPKEMVFSDHTIPVKQFVCNEINRISNDVSKTDNTSRSNDKNEENIQISTELFFEQSDPSKQYAHQNQVKDFTKSNESNVEKTVPDILGKLGKNVLDPIILDEGQNQVHTEWLTEQNNPEQKSIDNNQITDFKKNQDSALETSIPKILDKIGNNVSDSTNKVEVKIQLDSKSPSTQSDAKQKNIYQSQITGFITSHEENIEIAVSAISDSIGNNSSDSIRKDIKQCSLNTESIIGKNDTNQRNIEQSEIKYYIKNHDYNVEIAIPTLSEEFKNKITDYVITDEEQAQSNSEILIRKQDSNDKSIDKSQIKILTKPFESDHILLDNTTEYDVMQSSNAKTHNDNLINTKPNIEFKVNSKTQNQQSEKGSIYDMATNKDNQIDIEIDRIKKRDTSLEMEKIQEDMIDSLNYDLDNIHIDSDHLTVLESNKKENIIFSPSSNTLDYTTNINEIKAAALQEKQTVILQEFDQLDKIEPTKDLPPPDPETKTSTPSQQLPIIEITKFDNQDINVFNSVANRTNIWQNPDRHDSKSKLAPDKNSTELTLPKQQKILKDIIINKLDSAKPHSNKWLSDIRTSLNSSDILSSINKSNSIVILDFMFHSYLDNRKQRTISTVEDDNAVKRYPNDSIIVIKSEINLSFNDNGQKICIPLDSENNMIIQIEKKYETLSNITGAAPNLTSNQRETHQTIPKINHGSPVQRSDLGTIVTDQVDSTLSDIYEQNLLPLQSLIRSLKCEIDALTQQQTVLKKKVLDLKETKTACVITYPNKKLDHVNLICCTKRKT